MSTQPRILVFAGSARRDSFNKRLARLAARMAKAAGAEVTYVDLADYPMPLFDQDLEAQEGEHPNAKAFKDLMRTHDGFIIASPEHNSTYSALLKNTIDWASRKREGEKPLECFAGKTAAIVSASPGQLGGLRGLVTLRMLLNNLGVLVIPNQLAIPGAGQAFSENGSLTDTGKTDALNSVVERLVAVTGKLA